MNIVKGDKVVMTNGLERVNLIGETFEVANITETAVVLRDPNTKVAICSVDIDDFDQHFEKPESVKGWTKWCYLLDGDGNIFAFYRSRPEKGKVEVKVPFDNEHVIRKSAACSQGDMFNLEFGIRLALLRCEKESYKRNKIIMEESAKYYEGLLVDNKNKTNELIASLFGDEENSEN